MNPIPRLKPYEGPVFLSYGFRPFFFLGACQAALFIAIWLPLFEGEIAIQTLFVPRDWHAHEMLFGYVPAVLTGFLLTAIPNWTGRFPLQGTPLVILIIVWLSGRAAIGWSVYVGWLAAAAIDVAFLVLVAGAAAREIIAGQNWRNLKVLIPVTILALANIGFHAEAHFSGVADYSVRAGITAILILIMLIGRRIVPSFTRNWLVRENPGRLPAPFGAFDVIAIGIGAVALSMWLVLPSGLLTGTALCAAGILQLVRLAPLGGRAHWQRTSRPRAAYCLRFPSFGLRSFRIGCIRLGPAQLRSACLDGGGGWDNDARRHDARKPWPHRPRSYRGGRHSGDLRCRHHRRPGACGGLVVPCLELFADPPRCSLLGGGLCRLRLTLWAHPLSGAQKLIGRSTAPAAVKLPPLNCPQGLQIVHIDLSKNIKT